MIETHRTLLFVINNHWKNWIFDTIIYHTDLGCLLSIIIAFKTENHLNKQTDLYLNSNDMNSNEYTFEKA